MRPNSTDSLNLLFKHSDELFELPDWARYYISVGRLAAVNHQKGRRAITTILTPTRSFGVGFIGLGIAIAQGAKREFESRAKHFRELLELERGTPVVYRQNPNNTMKGVLVNPKPMCGDLYLGVRVQKRESGGQTYYINEEKAFNVFRAYHSGELPKKQGGKNLQSHSAFTDYLLGEKDPVQLGLSSKMICVFVGKRNVIEEEFCNATLAVNIGGGTVLEGCLQDVLRVDRFVGKDKSFRSAIVPIIGRTPSAEIQKNVEDAVVFDGAAGFLKWGYLWGNRAQIVLLDRSDSLFLDAVSEINQRYSQNRIHGESFLPKNDPPPGVEISSFFEMNC